MAGKSWIPLSGYKKVQEDGQKATLVHPHGHEITLAKSLLSDNMKQQLAQLPMHQKMAKGGRARRMADGGDTDPYNLGVEGVDVPERGLFERSNPGDPANGQRMDQLQQLAQQSPGLTSFLQNRQGQAQAQQQVQQQQQQAQPQGRGHRQARGPIAPYSENPMTLLNRGARDQLGGIQGAADAQSQGLSNQAQALDMQGGQLRQDLGAFNTIYNNRMKEITDLAADYGKKANDIDPNHYWDSKSTGSKIANGIGLLLGGLGGGLQGTGQNPVMNFMQQQIQNDIHAQAMNLDKKKNLLGANLQILGNMQDAFQMTYAQKLAMLGMDIQKYGMQSDSELIKSQAMQQKGQVWDQIGQHVMGWTMQGLMGAKSGYGAGVGQSGSGMPGGAQGGAPGGQGQPQGPGQPPQQQQQNPSPWGSLPNLPGGANVNPAFFKNAVPMPAGGPGGYGFANSEDAAAKAKETTRATDSLNAAIQRYRQAESTGTAFNPLGADWTEKNDALDHLQTVVRDLTGPGKPLEMQKEALQNMLPKHSNPGFLFGTQEQAKTKSLQQMTLDQMNAAYQAYLNNYQAPKFPADPRGSYLPGSDNAGTR